MATSITKTFEDLPKWAKVLLILFFGWVISPIFRIIRFVETKNVVTLVVGIVGLVSGIGNVILEIIDLVTEITSNKITILAD